MQESEHYSPDFFQGQVDGSISSASVMVPLILDVFEVTSVVDVGCGVGGWLREFSKHGVDDYLGIDGSYVKRDQLQIPPDKFRPRDLTELRDIGRRFDLACSLEVAEHLPEKCAEQFVSALVKAAPVIVFSAAIKGQGGTNHINEQWQSYWSKLFENHGYVVIDFLRRAVFADRRVEPWYRQNTLVYCHPDHRPAHLPVATNIDLVLPEINSIGTQTGKEAAKIPISGKEAAAAIVSNVRVLGHAVSRRILRR
jgi:SAM-dependent methyltransferase